MKPTFVFDGYLATTHGSEARLEDDGPGWFLPVGHSNCVEYEYEYEYEYERGEMEMVK